MSENPGTTPAGEGQDPQVPPTTPDPTPASAVPPEPAPPAAPGYPPAGSYPPPGDYPPPGAHPAGAYEQPGGSGVDVMAAFTWGWKKFTENAGPIVLAVLGYVVGLGVIIGIWYAIMAAVLLGASDDLTIDANGNIHGGGPSMFATLFFVALMALVVTLLVSVFQAGFIQGALRISQGEKLTVDAFFKFKNLSAVILASLLVGVLAAIGYALCYLPGIVFMFFAMFTMYYVVDRGLGAVDALKASFQLVSKNAVTVLLLFLGIAVVTFVGGLVCFVGTLVALPLALLAQTYVYRRLNNEPVVD
ncbi:hypothetical protein [Cellulomonas composti]|uniref:DUF7847 domain-containing protein n=1 Tax=Cellulomonas composti TaxID=266130 RepID=A0A511JDW6_9CELL|nr:hypothetical protein [Cellulomonas composti]GEL96190.1 hypothetical protein CCO02nite_28480 [Cellulomonas composti]